jgi:glutamyl-tRNA reductase
MNVSAPTLSDSSKMKEKKLVVIGDGETAEMAYEYFTYDSAYEVVAFAVEA